MTHVQVAPYGSWKSPITSDLIVSSVVGLSEPRLDGDILYWLESRPSEGGRNVVMTRDPEGVMREITPPEYNVRTRAHEYGGGAYVVHQGTVYFSNDADGRVYTQSPQSPPVPLTAEGPFRYADLTVDTARGCIVCVREDHTESDREADTTLVSVALDDGAVTVLASGSDFYASPTIAPDGRSLAWITWEHPNMPWDSAELHVAALTADGTLQNFQTVAGGGTESVVGPVWSPGDTLYFSSDRSGWWNLYRWTGGSVEEVTSLEAEFGAPHWVFGWSKYAFCDERRLVCSVTESAVDRLMLLDTENLSLAPVHTPFTSIAGVQARESGTVFIAAGPDITSQLVEIDLQSEAVTVVARASSVQVDPRYLSVPDPIEFPTTGGATGHAFFYAPHNEDFRAPAGELPPLIVFTHGGPTSHTRPVLNLQIQYWTSRGFGVVDVNYGGSTGYGRAYRERLKGRWGIVDIDDCVAAARYLVEAGRADPQRLIIRGGSAGGFTTLAALVFRDEFRAGASYYGVADLAALATDTHKFESQYLTSLVAPYPEGEGTYRERSPIHFTERISAPVIVFQGLEDRVVPPVQAEIIVQALDRKGLPHAYVPFEGEGHGFRKAENIKRALDAELYFYAQVFRFPLGQPVEPVPIANMGGPS